MKRHRHIKSVLLLIGSVLASFQFAQAQQPAKIPRVGYVSATGDGSNQSTEQKSALSRRRHWAYSSLVFELVQLRVDILVVLPAIRAAKEATKTIPLIMIISEDPVAAGSWIAWPVPVETSPALRDCSAIKRKRNCTQNSTVNRSPSGCGKS